MTVIPEPAREPDPVKTNKWLGENPGDTLTGLVTAREEHESGEEFGGRKFSVLTVRNGDGIERELPCARKHLRQLVEEHDPQPSDGIAVTFFGEDPSGYGFLYAMRVVKAEGGNPGTQEEMVPDDESVPF